MAAIPLLKGADLAAPFASAAGRIITVREWLGEAQALARMLPPHRYLLNYCEDRYRFSVAFAAALLRGQTNLLPPSRAPETLRRLRAEYPDMSLLVEPGTAPQLPGTMVYPELSAKCEPVSEVPAIGGEQVAAILFTSGSTGTPVPYAKPWGPLASGAAGEALRLELPPCASLVGTVPPQHMYGLESTVILAWQNGCLLHAGRPFYPADIRSALASVPAPRVLVTTPLHLRALLDEERSALPPIARIVSATAMLSQELAQRAESVLGAPVFEIYGCTETGMVASRRTLQGSQWRTLPGVRIRAAGERFLAGGGHVPEEAALADELDLIDGEHFELLGRLSDVVNIAGKRTSLACLTSELMSIPGVRDGVFFLPPESGEKVTRLRALAVAPGLTRKDVLRALRSRVDPVFLPRPLLLVQALPRNATGKLPRDTLLQFAARLEREGGRDAPLEP